VLRACIVNFDHARGRPLDFELAARGSDAGRRGAPAPGMERPAHEVVPDRAAAGLPNVFMTSPRPPEEPSSGPGGSRRW
jgi:hypothetical protein